MTKAEEREVLQKICDLIKSTGTDSYISMAFRGVPEYAERNIAEDAAYNPVDELGSEYAKNLRKDSEYGQKLLKLEHENQALQTHLDEEEAEIEKLGHLLDAKTAECERLKDERDVMVECHDGLAEMVDRYELEIQRLKAEVYDLRKWGESPVVYEEREKA